LDPGGEAIPVRLPFALVVAAQLPPISPRFRPLLGLWCLAHFAAGGFSALVCAMAHRALAVVPVERVLVPSVSHFGVLFAVNLYLMLAVAVFIRQPAVLNRLWRWRLAVDLALILVTPWFVLNRF